jgi:hypothetical protein
MTAQAMVGKRVALYVVLVLASSGGMARAQDWALVTIENATNQTIKYSYRWSKDGASKTVSLAPGKARNHSIPFGGANQKRPRFYISFDAAKGAPEVIKKYHLAEGFAPRKDPSLGERHVFRDGATSIDIFHRPAQGLNN